MRKYFYNVLYDRPDEFKKAILKFGKLNYREEHTIYVDNLDNDLKIALVCSLLHNGTRELVSELTKLSMKTRNFWRLI